MKKLWIILLFIQVSAACLAADNPVELYQAALNHQGRSDEDLTRDKTSKPLEMLKILGVQPGMTVLDLFAGGGYYTEIMSHVVGKTGKVYMYNNQAYMGFVGKEIVTRLADDRLANVVKHKRETSDMELPDATFDVVIMVMAYHDLYYKEKNWEIDGDKLFAQVLKSMKPGARILVIDHAAAAGTGEKAAQKLHRIDEKFALEDIARHGLKLVSQSNVLRNKKDDKTLTAFDPKVRRKTDRFVYLFEKQ